MPARSTPAGGNSPGAPNAIGRFPPGGSPLDFLRSRRLLAAFLLALALGCRPADPVVTSRGDGPPLARPVALSPAPGGRLLVCDEAAGQVLLVDPATGDRTDVTGSGPGRVAPAGAVSDARGRVWFCDRTGRAIHRVDPRTGRRVLVSGAARGEGAALGDPTRIDRLPDGTLIVLDRGLPGLVRVDPVRGDRRPLARLQDPVDLLVTADHGILVLENQPNTLVSVDPVTGAQRLAADLKRGEGPMGLDYLGLAAGREGEILLAEDDARLVLSLDLATGRRRELTRPSRPGALMRQAFDVLPLADGAVAVSSPWAGALLRVGPDGRRTVLSGGPLPDGTLSAVPFSLATTPDGTVLLTDVLEARLLALVGSDGRFREVSGPGRGRGPALRIPVGLAADPGGGRAWIGDRGQGVVEVDLATGDRRLLAPVSPEGLRDATLVAALPEGGLYVLDLDRRAVLQVRPDGVHPLPDGGGPALADPTSLASGRGSLLIPDFETATVVAVDPATGARHVVSGGSVGSGPPLHLPDSLLAHPDGDLLVGQETDPGSVVRVDPAGNRREVPLLPVPGTPELDTPTSMVMDAQGRLLIADPGGLGCLFAVEPDGSARALDLLP